MNIVFASEHCCIRGVKQAIMLMNAGHQIFFLANRIIQPSYLRAALFATFYNGPEDFNRQLYRLTTATDIDLIHVHNEPSYLGWLAKETCPMHPVVFDVHDLHFIRTGNLTADEEKSLSVCDGIVFPSQSYKNECQALFGNKPAEVIYSFCNQDVLNSIIPMPYVGGICYQGGILTKVKKGGPEKGFEYANYKELARVLLNNSIPFYLYGANSQYQHTYTELGAICSPQLEYSWLMNNLPRHAWGFCGPGMAGVKQWNCAMPNKFFEYLSAGVPIMVFSAEEVAEVVEREGFGVVISSFDEIPAVYHDAALQKQCRENILKRRPHYIMENQYHKLLKLYCAAEKQGIIHEKLTEEAERE